MINAPSSRPRLTSLELRKRLEGGLAIGVVSKRTYRIRDSRCELSQEQVPLVEEPVLADDGVLEHDSDRILQRKLVDVVIHGKARAPAATGSFTVSVQLDGERRDIAVFGRRTLRLQSGALSISAPEPVAEVDLTWKNAYGGVDRVLLANEGDPLIQIAEAIGERLDPEQSLFAYPRNPHGRGYLIEASEAAVAAAELPHLEDPARPLTAQSLLRRDPYQWPLAPLPVSTAWLPYVHFPRSAQTGLPIPLFARDTIEADRFPEVVQGILRAEALLEGAPMTQRIDIGCAQGAAPAMRFAKVDAGSIVELRNVHPQHAIWRWQLPLERPRVAYRFGAQPSVELEAKICALRIEPDANLVSVVWVGEHTLQQPVSREMLERAEYGMKWKSEP